MNQRVLLDRLFQSGPAIRPQLARDSGLSLPTVIAALSDLEAMGLVRSTRQPQPGQGRPALLYEANPHAGAVIAADIGHQWLHVRVTDLAGTTLSHVDARNTKRSAPALVNRVSEAVTEATSQADIDADAIVHTVIGSPGVFDERHRRVLYAANLPGWQRTGLAEALAARLGTSVTIDNDANLAALAEYCYGAGRNARTFAYITIGTGVGLGFILDGEIYRGFSGSAGEVGFLPVGDQPPSSQTGQPRRGMLETSLAADAVVRYARGAGMTGNLTAEGVFAAARDGNHAARRAVEVMTGFLARLIVSTCAFLDPELIAIGGGVGQNLDILEQPMREVLKLITPMQIPEIIAGALGTEAVVLGATARGLELAREAAFAARTVTTR